METNFLLLERKADDEGEKTIYTILFPLMEGSFRACLQGNKNDTLELFLESGMPPIFPHASLNQALLPLFFAYRCSRI